LHKGEEVCIESDFKENSEEKSKEMQKGRKKINIIIENLRDLS
jgi:hypothetical protein